MKKVLPLVVVGLLAWYGYSQYQKQSSTPQTDDVSLEFASTSTMTEVVEDEEARPSFTCDERIYCSEMTSCAEAEYFLENCPGVKMDGGGDGVPCEKQWCGNR